MGASKYGVNDCGVWKRDAHGLPLFEAESGQFVSSQPDYMHPLASGLITALADPMGRVSVYAAIDGKPVSLSAPSRFSCGAFLCRIRCGDEVRSLLPGTLLSAENGSIQFGIGFFQYEGTLNVSGHSLQFSLTCRTVPGQGWLAVELELAAQGAALDNMTVEVISDALPPVAGEDYGIPFARNGVAMLTDLHPVVGDWVLAAGEPWEASAVSNRLLVHRTIDLQPDEPWLSKFQVGCQRDCTIARAQASLDSINLIALSGDMANAMKDCTCLAPELWMREDILWSQAYLLSCALSADEANSRVLFPGVGVHGGGRVSSRELLQLAVAVSATHPDLALANLEAVTQSQASFGRIPEDVNEQVAIPTLDPRKDRSDLEIWFLVAWCDYLSGREDREEVLGRKYGFSDGESGSLWDHLVRAVRFIRDEVRCGQNGHVRMLAGDSCDYLNGVGAQGYGESVLNSAMLVYALGGLHDDVMRMGDKHLIDWIQSWYDQLSLAVGEAFENGWFCRGFDDRGRVVGGQEDGRLFLDIQTWAVLAKCGTIDQREKALQEALEKNCFDHEVCSLSNPYPLPPAESVSSLSLMPGDGYNGGMILPQVAWFCWALIEENMAEAAIKCWENMAIRKRLTLEEMPCLAACYAQPQVRTHFAGYRAGLKGYSADGVGVGINAQTVAWQLFAMNKIVGSSLNN